MGLSLGIQAGIVDKIEKQGYSESKLLADDVAPVVLRATANATQNFPSGSTRTKVAWNTTVFDTASQMDLTLERYTFIMGGYYHVSCSQGFTTIGTVNTGALFDMEIAINGTKYCMLTNSPGRTTAYQLHGDTLIEVNEDDYLEIFITIGGNGGVTAVRGADVYLNYLTIHRIRG
jgi:hypothetical protein